MTVDGMSGAAPRLRSLDGLRGIAAMAVVLNHAAVVLYGSDFFRPRPPFSALWNGHAAVIVFFIMSGLVLSLPYWRGAADGWRGFMVRRLFRIYPLFAVSILIVPVLIWLVSATGGHWRDQPSWSDLLADLAMVDRPVDQALNGSTWSLIHEMRLSIVFPGLILAMRLAGRRAVPLALLFSICASFAADFVAHDFVVLSWLLSASFVWLFVLGAEIGRNLPAIQARLGRLPPLPAVSIALGLLAVLSFDRWDGIAGIRLFLFHDVAAGLLVILAVGYAPLVRLLEIKPVHWLGRVSYSLYLIHGPLLWAMHGVVPAPVPRVAAVALAVVLSLLAAEPFYRLVERPGIRIGHRLAARVGMRPALSQGQEEAPAK